MLYLSVGVVGGCSEVNYKFDMEELAAVYVCEGFIRECLLPRACAALPPDNRAIAAFSLKQSAALTDSLVVSEDYCPDHPRGRLSEDVPTVIHHKPAFRQYTPAPMRPSLQPKTSSFRRSSKASRGRDAREDAGGSGFLPTHPKLTPLNTCQDSSQEESEDLESKLRERKIHQQYFRTRYEENLKQGALRKKGFAGKLEGKGHNLVAYDFDGAVIPPNNKPQPLKLPLHFLDLQVSLGAPREEEKAGKKASRVRIEGREGRREEEGRGEGRREELKIAESHFFKDFGNIHWSEGVELRQSKEECRKILGYQNPNAGRKKVDLFKHSEQPVRIRLQDLNSYKNLLSSNSQHFLSQENLRQSEKSMLLASSHSIHPDTKAKFITVTNSRALEFLIDNESPPDTSTPVPPLNRSAFSKSKQLRFRS